MVAGRFGRAGDPEFLQVCEEVSGGVPSVLRAVLDEVLGALQRGWATELP